MCGSSQPDGIFIGNIVLKCSGSGQCDVITKQGRRAAVLSPSTPLVSLSEEAPVVAVTSD